MNPAQPDDDAHPSADERAEGRSDPAGSEARDAQEEATRRRIANPRATSVTARAFDVLPLQEAAREDFERCVKKYGELIEHALEHRAFKIDNTLSDGLRALAEGLGFLRATPRDVVEIHAAALAKRQSSMSPERLAAYMEEGRIALLELMGYLASYYRKQSMGRSA